MKRPEQVAVDRTRAVSTVLSLLRGDANVDNDVNWTHVLWAARSQGVVLPVAAALEDVSGGPDVDELRAELAQFRAATAFNRLARDVEIGTIQEVLSQKGIAALSLSSCAFCAAGHDRPDVRELGDATRFLVAEDDLARTRAVIHASGYELGAEQSERLVSPGRSVISLMFQPRWMNSSRHATAARAVVATWFANAQHVPLGVHRVPTLSRADWLTHRSAALGLGIRRLSLRRALDIVRLASGASRDEIEQFLSATSRLGVGPRVAAAILASFRLFAQPVPDALNAVLAAPRIAARSMRLADARCARVAAGIQGPLRIRRGKATVTETLGRFAPTPVACVVRMLELANVGTDDVVFDLGCGDGRIVLAAARDRGAKGVGIDRDPERISESVAAAARFEAQVRFLQGDANTASLDGATVVCLYVTPKAFNPLLRRLFAQLRPGARIVSHNGLSMEFPPDKMAIIRSSPFSSSFISVWVVPDR